MIKSVVVGGRGTAVGARPLKHLNMASTGCIGTRRLVPGTGVGARPLEHLEMASLGCIYTGPLGLVASQGQVRVQ
jgi:hypothetical protein